MTHPNIQKSDRPGLGVGLFASGPIAKDEVIATFDGKRYEDFDENEFPPEIDPYPIQYSERCWRDSESIARFSNHSCEPNSGIRELFSIVAMRDIKAGEEITWDYDMSDDSEWSLEGCLCGSSRCRGSVTGYRNLPQSFREDYRGYISQWLLDKHGEV